MRAWDSYDTYLFDIDGTLLHCEDAVHYFAFCHVLKQIAGRPLNLDGVVTQGNVDVGILRDALALAKIPEAFWRPRIAQMRDHLCGFVEDHADEFSIRVLPGVRSVLAHLRARDATLAVATGNLERIGWAKLAFCGLKAAFHFGAFSDLHEDRTQVFAAALALSRALNPTAAVCVIGDTPADIQAAHENGLEVIAVATGIHSSLDLDRFMPDKLIHNLEDLFTDTTTEHS